MAFEGEGVRRSVVKRKGPRNATLDTTTPYSTLSPIPNPTCNSTSYSTPQDAACPVIHVEDFDEQGERELGDAIEDDEDGTTLVEDNEENGGESDDSDSDEKEKGGEKRKGKITVLIRSRAFL